MASLKDRLGRLENRIGAMSDESAIRNAAEEFGRRMAQILRGFDAADAAMPLDERLGKMSPAQHMAWCIRFVPGFQVDTGTPAEFMAMHRIAA